MVNIQVARTLSAQGKATEFKANPTNLNALFPRAHEYNKKLLAAKQIHEIQL